MGEEANFPAGYRFNPTKVELIEQYLKRKVSGKPLPSDIIKEVELYDLQPKVLYERFPNKRIRTRYFFTKGDKRFRNKKHRDRKVKNGGRWICSIGDKPVIKNGGRHTGGVYKTLTYYEGNDRSKKTGWIMTEYRLSQESKLHQPTADPESDWLLCEIHYKGNKAKDNEGDDHREEDMGEDPEEPDQLGEGIGESQPEPWLASTPCGFACHDEILLSIGEGIGESQPEPWLASTPCGFACQDEILLSIGEGIGESQPEPWLASAPYGFACHDEILLGMGEDVQVTDASNSYRFNTCNGGGGQLVPCDCCFTHILSNLGGSSLPDYIHLPASFQVASPLSNDGTGNSQVASPLSNDGTGVAIEDSPPYQAPMLFACDWNLGNPEELQAMIDQYFPNLEEDVAQLGE